MPKQYIKQTSEVRNGADQPWRSYQKPHNPASKDTVSRWRKELLKQSGIDIYHPMGHIVLVLLPFQLHAPHQTFPSRLSWMLLDGSGKVPLGNLMINQLTQRVKTLESNFYCIVMKSSILKPRRWSLPQADKWLINTLFSLSQITLVDRKILISEWICVSIVSLRDKRPKNRLQPI